MPVGRRSKENAGPRYALAMVVLSLSPCLTHGVRAQPFPPARCA